MADFEGQVGALTSISTDGSSTPTQNELTQFLKDGVLDVTSRWLSVKPGDAAQFQREHTESTSQGGITVTGPIIDVLRETGTDEDWRSCRRIGPDLQSRVTDITSMDYASKYNPAYQKDDNNVINVFPTPAGSNNAYKVYYVNDVPTDQTNGAALLLTHSDIKYFPKDKVHLVVLYATIKVIEAKISSFTIDEEDETLVASYKQSLDEYKDQYESYFDDTKKAQKDQNERMQAMLSQLQGGRQ